jgi:hypothetical protein
MTRRSAATVLSLAMGLTLLTGCGEGGVGGGGLYGDDQVENENGGEGGGESEED